MLDRRQFVGLSAAFALAPALPARPAFAQASPVQGWPSRIVKLVVPFTPGGGIDGIGRILGARLSEMWGQQVVVENKPGAGGNIASEQVARSAPDGYTMYISAAGLAINRYLFPSINYDPIADFAPVTLICLFPNLLVVPQDSKFRSVGEIIAHAKANPGKLTFAGSTPGSLQRLAGELLKRTAGFDMLFVPYKGTGAMMPDLLGGRLHVAIDNVLVLTPFIKNNTLRALGVTTTKRSTIFPELPTLAETGVPGFHATGWFGVFGAVRTPPAIVARLNTDLSALMREPDMRERLVAQGAEALTGSPDDLRRYLAREMEVWGRVIREAGIKAE
jgi:tripartite-type tricarboxylate transporter receptor subunit TctC